MDALATLLDPGAVEDDDITSLFPEEVLDPEAEKCRLTPWKCPKKPTAARVLAEAEQLKSDHAYRVLVQKTMHDWLSGKLNGTFVRDTEAIRNNEITPVTLDGLKNEHFDYVTFHASMQVRLKLRGRQVIDDEEVDAIQDGARLLWQAWCDQYQGHLLTALADGLGRRGALAAYIAPDPTNAETGICFHLLDPANCYPVWEGKRGLARVYVCYWDTAERVIGDYGDNGGKVARKVRKIARRDNDEDDTYDALTENEVIVCYDRRWTTVCWGGELIRQDEHRYGKCPVEWQGSSVGLQEYMHSPDSSYVLATDTETIPTLGIDGFAFTSRQMDMAERDQPMLWRRVKSHAETEALMSRLYSKVRRDAWKPPVVIAQTNQSAGEGEPERDPGEDGATFIRADDRVEQYPGTVDPQMLAIVQTMMTQNMLTGMSPTVGSPNPAGAQASGNAIDMLTQSGAQRWLPITYGVTGFIQHCLRCALDIWAEHGDSLAPDGEEGMLIPRSTPSKSLMGMTDPHILDQETLQRVGTKIDVSLGKFNAASLAPLVQAVMMARQSQLMSQELAVTLLGAAEDIEQELRQIEQDQLNQTPEILSARNLRFYRDAAMRALSDGDMPTAQELMLTGKYLADQNTIAMMSRLSMVSQATMEAMQMGVNPQQAQPGQMGAGGQPAMQPTPALPAGQPQPNAAPYLSPNQFGGTTGQVSPGRPPVNAGY